MTKDNDDFKKFKDPVIMYAYETWTLRKYEQNKLLIFDSKIPNRIFEP